MSFQDTFKDSNGLSIPDVGRQVIPFNRSSKIKRAIKFFEELMYGCSRRIAFEDLRLRLDLLLNSWVMYRGARH